MRTLWVVATLALMPALAKADENYTQLGGFFGPRIFSQHGLLGYNDDQPYHPDLVNGIGLGVRAGRSFCAIKGIANAKRMIRANVRRFICMSDSSGCNAPMDWNVGVSPATSRFSQRQRSTISGDNGFVRASHSCRHDACAPVT